ncbi:MAG: 3-oxoacyl-ACP reductase FabG [Clostridiales bacterium]|nr:3-oxoacyl-ACP reductase FabG [Clostridiales bacterium]
MKRTVLITGSSRGIGRAIALKLAEGNYNIVINYKERKDKANELVDIIRAKGNDCIAISADVSDYDQVKNMFNIIFDRFGKVDILVNNAGISVYGMLQDITIEDWHNVYGTNVHGMFYCTKEAIPKMISQKYGKIINISSMWGSVGASCESLYASTKGAINIFTKSIAKELAPSGITANVVAPGVVLTDMLSQLGEEALEVVREETPLGRHSQPEEIADVVEFLISEKGDFFTGQIISPNGGLVI